jgi:hypothetical protein
MSEKQAYALFKKHIARPMDRIDRIESGLTVEGMPDINACFDGVECWIELKSPTEPKRATTPLFGSNHKLSMSQRNWFLRQRNAGGHAFILVCTDIRWLLLGGALADKLNEMTVDEMMDAARWAAMKPIKEVERWTSLRHALTIK